ncbi:aminopeptidase P family protein [Spiroplasma endosymbiont of Polydrusus formosus]|uniref:aminopeptidase P family protein n=1 Tax=Spiroplasma endosymbiont of Polydrusus formosus TaxID=3139326 RepID=UPI0035B55204
MEYVKTKLDKTAKLKEYLTKYQIDGVLLHSTVNRFWFSEFASLEGYLLFTKNESILYLDGRYITAGKIQAKNVTNVVKITTNNAGGFWGMLQNDLTKNNVKVLAFESDHLTYLTYQSLKTSLSSEITLKPVDFSELRAIKTNAEIIALQKACAIGDLAINNVIKKIKIGITERAIEQIIINTFIEAGADKPSFDTIVASGWRGSLPHGRATDKKIENNELITIDFGCIYDGYCSDTTRTIGLGKPPAKMLEIFDVVYQAQKQGIEAIKPGVTTSSIDKICRDYIISKGYGKYFTHSTGHGVGIKIHEFPRVSPFCDVLLEPGMIITVEPRNLHSLFMRCSNRRWYSSNWKWLSSLNRSKTGVNFNLS